MAAKPPDRPVADYTEADGPPWAAPAAARPDAWPPGPHLTAPETVHWAMTYACAAGCPDCYARRHRHRFPDEMSTGDALRLVDRLAAWGVFQVAIGGGEPLERPDLPEVAAHARRLGLVVHVTTGRHQVDGRLLDRLAAGVSVLQFGVKAEPLLGDPAVAEALEASVAGARAMGIHTAANVMLSRGVIARFEEVLSALAPAGLRQVTLLRYKPPANVERWLREKPSTETLRAFEVDLPGVLARHPDLSLRVDCALSFLQRRVGPAAALAAGVRGCVAGQRILALAPAGSAFPCSQLVHPAQRAGSALEDDLERLWSASPVLRRYRLFRDNPEFCRTACGVCTARDHCGGWRVFAADAWGAEPECPDPILPPLEKMGKNGRLLDLERYLAEHLWITVGEYMQRYGVLQERAVKDLRAASCTVAPVEGTGRKQSDCYYSAREVEVLSLQESIGCTSGGWPFVSREEILAWQAHWNGADHEHYPRWLLPTTRQEAPAQGKNESHDHGVGPAGSAGSDRADRAPTGEWRGDPECGDPFTEETPPAIEPRRRKGQR